MRRVAAAALALLLAGCAKQRDARLAFDPDSVASAYTGVSGALMWPGATRAFRVTETGALENGAWRVAFEAGADGREAAPPKRIAALDRSRPYLRWTRHGEGVRWEFAAVAFPAPAPADTQMLVSLQARAINESEASHTARLRASLGPLGPDPIYVAFDAPERGTPHLAWGTRGTRDTACAWAATTASDGALVLDAALPPRGDRVFELLLSTYPMPGAELERLARVPHARRAAEALARWDAWLAAGASVELGDLEVERAWNAAVALLLACRERHDGRLFPTGGGFQYHDVWLRDGARVVHGLAVAGHVAEARELTESMLRVQWPNGAFVTQRGQLDGTGQALWGLEQALLRDPGHAPSDTVLAAGLRAWRWIEWQRSPGARPAASFATMMTFADPRDAELVRAQLTGNDAWAIAGEDALARLLRAAGRTAQADSVEADAHAYRADFSATLARIATPDVPPSWQRTGRDWGNLAVGWPCATLLPGDPHLLATARRVWSQAADSGLASYGVRDSLHSYLGADLGTWALLAGRRDDFERVLASTLHWRDATGCAAELFSADGGYGRNLPPHPTAAAGVVALVRNALVFDDADTLRLTMGARAAWWRGAHVRRAPTWWGPLDVAFRRDGDAAAWEWTPVPVATVLTLPPGTRLAEAPAAPMRAMGDARVLVPAGARAARVRLAPL